MHKGLFSWLSACCLHRSALFGFFYLVFLLHIHQELSQALAL